MTKLNLKRQLTFCCALLAISTAPAQTPLSDGKYPSLFDKGRQLYEMKKFSAARGAFEAYLSGGALNNVADARYFQAFSALSEGHADAEGLLEQFLSDFPDHPRAIMGYFNAANFYYSQPDYEKASSFYSKAQPDKLSPVEQAELYFRWGYSLFNLSRFEEALPKFEEAKTRPGNFAAPACYYAGYIRLRQKQYDAALADLQAAGSHQGYDAIVPELLSAAMYSKKDFRAVTNYTKPYISGEKEAKNEHEIALYTAESHYELKEYSKALPLYEQYMKALRKKPAAPVLFRVSHSYFKAGKPALAIDNFKYVALEKDALGQAASYYLGDLYVQEGNKAFAASAYRQASDALFDEKVRQQAMFKLAQVYMDLGNYREAIPVLEKYVSDYPKAVEIVESKEMMAEAFVNSTDYDKALAYFEKTGLSSVRMKKAYQKASCLKGIQLFNNGMFYEAVHAFDESLKYPIDQDTEVSAWLWKGEAYSAGKKYEEAIDSYSKVLAQREKSGPEAVSKANYGKGYALFNTKKYAEAHTYFKAYLHQPSTTKHPDAEVRLADCLYAQKQYEEALLHYKQAGEAGFKEKDYLLFQQGVITGFQNKVNKAKEYLLQVVKNYPGSRYADDALFQAAQLDFEAGNYAEAGAGFSQLLYRHPLSGFVPYSLVRRASCSYNRKEYRQAEDDYKKMLTDHPQHPLANSALLGLQEVLTILGKSDEVDEYIALYKKANPGDQSLEAVEYERARNLYFDQKYKEAIAALSGYRQAYPGSASRSEALYYTGESYFRLNETNAALEAYYSLLKDMQSVSPARIYQRIAWLEFKRNKQDEALKYWHRLKAVAGSSRDVYTANEGLMETHFSIHALDSARWYAEKILGEEKVSFNAQNKAGLYLGKIAFQKGQYGEAMDELVAVVNAAKDVNAAEAQYYIGLIQFNNKEYKRSLETLFGLNKSFAAYEEWLGKSFLLIADNYLAVNELFQAKATLESIVSNSPVAEIKEKARSKLAEVNKKEKETMVQKDSVNSPLKADSTGYISN